MARVSIEFECEIPDSADANDWQIEEWVRFSLGASGHIPEDNPLIDIELEAVFGTIWVTA